MKEETDLYAPIIAGAKTAGIHLYRLYDGTMGRKPFDIGGITPDGRAVGLEAKYCRARTKLHGNGEAVIPWSSFETQQVAYLKLFARNGGLPIVYVYYTTHALHAVFLLDEEDIGCNLPLPFLKMWEHTVGHSNTLQIMGWDRLLAISPRYPTPNIR